MEATAARSTALVSKARLGSIGAYGGGWNLESRRWTLACSSDTVQPTGSIWLSFWLLSWGYWLDTNTKMT
jgi:hypothetical protein